MATSLDLIRVLCRSRHPTRSSGWHRRHDRWSLPHLPAACCGATRLGHRVAFGEVRRRSALTSERFAHVPPLLPRWGHLDLRFGQPVQVVEAALEVAALVERGHPPTPPHAPPPLPPP